VTAALPVTRGIAPQVTVGQAGTDSGAGSYPSRAGTHPAGGGTREATLTAGRGTTLTERGYVHARFGGVPVLVAPELAAQLRTIGQKQP